MDYAGNGRPRRLMAGVCSTAPKTIVPGLRQQLQALSMLRSPYRPRTTGDDSGNPPPLRNLIVHRGSLADDATHPASIAHILLPDLMPPRTLRSPDALHTLRLPVASRRVRLLWTERYAPCAEAVNVRFGR